MNGSHTWGFRPRVVFEHPDTPEDIVAAVRAQIKRNNPADLRLRGNSRRFVLRFPSHLSQPWTPQLDMHMTVRGGTTHVQCIIGPAHRVWRLFRGAFLFFATLCVTSALVGSFQIRDGGAIWGFYFAVIGLAGALFLYFVSEEAKRRTRDESNLLRTFIASALGRDAFAKAVPAPKGRLAGGWAT